MKNALRSQRAFGETIVWAQGTTLRAHALKE
jgi:hypothetical protein